MKPTTTTYGGELLSIGYAGQIVDSNPAVIESKSNSATVAIDFGRAVARSSADDTCKAPAADADKIIGLSVRHAVRPADAAGNVTYAQYDAVPIVRSGFIYALATEAATRGDTVISITAGNGTMGSTTGGAAGAGRIALDGTAGNVKAVWETTTAAGAIGKIKVGA